MANVADVTKYADALASFEAGLNTTFQVTGVEAIKNVIKMYLWSANGDYGRDSTKGGILFDMIGKQLSQSNVDKLKKNIETGLSAFKYIVINKIDVGINTSAKQFTVSIVFSDTYNKFVDAINFGVQGTL